MKQIENNKLIAEFMQIPKNKDGTYNCLKVDWAYSIVEGTGYMGSFNENDLEFDSSWDWLMPVVEKIEKLGVSTEIHYFAGTKKHSTGHYGCWFLGYSKALSIYDNTNQYESKINAVYITVVKFIKWYNNK